MSGLTVGIYKVVVTDYNGCTYVTGDIYVDQPDEPLSALIDGVNGTCDPNFQNLLHYQFIFQVVLLIIHIRLIM